MKVILKFAAAVVFLSLSVKGIAETPILRLMKNGQSKCFFLNLESRQDETTINIVDENENRIFSEMVSKKSFKKKFNFKNLKEGSYYVNLDNSTKKITYIIHVEKNGIQVVDEIEKFKPIFNQVGQRLFLNLQNLDKSTIEIKIFDSASQEVYSEVLDNHALIKKSFNFETAFKDKYVVTIEDGDDVYYQNMEVN